MGAVIALILGVIALGLLAKIFKWIFRKLAKGIKFLSSLVILALYVWAFVEYPSITLWGTGALLVLALSGVAIYLHEINKIKREIIPLAQANDISGLEEIYSRYTESKKNLALNVIIESDFDNQNQIIEGLFLSDFLNFLEEHANLKTGHILVERGEFVSCFAAVWEGRLKRGVVEFTKQLLPEGIELDDSIAFQNQENKKQVIRLIKITFRRENDAFDGVIDLD